METCTRWEASKPQRAPRARRRAGIAPGPPRGFLCALCELCGLLPEAQPLNRCTHAVMASVAARCRVPTLRPCIRQSLYGTALPQSSILRYIWDESGLCGSPSPWAVPWMPWAGRQPLTGSLVIQMVPLTGVPSACLAGVWGGLPIAPGGCFCGVHGVPHKVFSS